nr:MAG: hypothetical protein 1 [Leviviridae sp.]
MASIMKDRVSTVDGLPVTKETWNPGDPIEYTPSLRFLGKDSPGYPTRTEMHEVITYSNRGRNRINSCLHYNYPSVFSPEPMKIADHKLIPVTKKVQISTGDNPDYKVVLDPKETRTDSNGTMYYEWLAKHYYFYPLSDPSSDQERVKTAWCEMQTGGSFDTTGIVRSILELKDFKDIDSQLSSFLTFVGSLTTGKATLRDAAAQYLFGKFGIEPTIGELDNFKKLILGEIQYAVNGLLKLQTGKAPLSGTVKARTVIPNFGSGQLGLTQIPVSLSVLRPGTFTRVYKADGGWQGPTHHQQVAEWVWDTVNLMYAYRLYTGVVFAHFDATLVLRYVPELTEHLLSFTQLFRTAWELIPMSFVVDWFVNTKDIFRRVQAIWQSAFCELSPVDGVWSSMGYSLGVGQPDLLVGYRNLMMVFGDYVTDVNGRRWPQQVEIVATYLPSINPMFYELREAGWKYRRRREYFTAGELLMPRLNIRLTPGKIGSLLALIGSK